MGADARVQSRREFIKTAAVVAAGAPFVSGALPHATLPVNQSLRSSKPLGFALVGLGSLSTNQIAPALQKTTNCRLAAIVTGTPAKAAKWKAQYNLPDRSIYTYETMQSMAANPDIDVVYVVTPNALHAEHTIKAAQAGKHVLCEKPMEVSTAKCEAMIAACRKAGRQLAIGYRCRFEPHHLELARLAREKTFGNVKIIETGFGFPIGDPTQWRLNRALAGGGPLMDVGIYSLQAARMITGEEPIKISAMSVTTDPVKFKDIEESMTFALTFPSGIIANCTTTYRVGGINRVNVYAERGSFGMAPAFDYTGNKGWRSDGTPLRFDPVDHFATEMDDFALCLMNGTPTKVPGEEGLRDLRILMAAYESARTGQVVRLTG
jgi:predicted dehydrogenase